MCFVSFVRSIDTQSLLADLFDIGTIINTNRWRFYRIQANMNLKTSFSFNHFEVQRIVSQSALVGGSQPTKPLSSNYLPGHRAGTLAGADWDRRVSSLKVYLQSI